jgi:phosphatidylserine/phosphatidylglycerophosphate/cardiolipin synthase-like enzyme
VLLRFLKRGNIFSFLFYFSFVLCSFLIFFPDASLALADSQYPLQIYHGPRDRLDRLLFDVIDHCKESLYIECYAIDYPPLLEKIKNAVERGLKVEIFLDPKASPGTQKYFQALEAQSPAPIIRAYTGKALMHRKLLIQDGETIYFGSANFTRGSLLQHENILVGIHNPLLAKALIPQEPHDANRWPVKFDKTNPLQGGFSIETPQYRAKFYQLPDEKFAAQSQLYKTLENAQKSIHIAMFTFTHAKIANILKERALQGVAIKIVLDQRQQRLSEKILPLLQEAGIAVTTHPKQQLFHHKWALIDRKHWVVGSVNWTKNGLNKNTELIAFIEIIDPELEQELTDLWLECSNF